MQLKTLGIAAAIITTGILLAGCSADSQEQNTTYTNHQQINQNLPVPSITFSSRRQVLIEYYKQVLDKPRLRTCTTISSRGASNGQDIIAVAETIGMPVNMSNQVTSPGLPEPDSVYPGPNDQTVFVLRNGIGVATEADTTGITGDCPPNVKPDSLMQKIIDFQAAQPEGASGVNFLPPQK